MKDLNINGGHQITVTVNEAPPQGDLFEKRSEAITLKLTPSEREAIEKLASEPGLPPSVVARECLVALLELRGLRPAMAAVVNTLEGILGRKIF